MTLMEYMTDRDLSYRAMAVRLAVDHAYLYRLVRGQRKMPLDLALKIQLQTDGLVRPEVFSSVAPPVPVLQAEAA